MVRKKIAWEIYIISGVITFLVLVAGIFLGVFFSEKKVEFLESELAKARLSQNDATLQFILLQYFPNESCAILKERFYKIQMEAAKLGSQLEDYERTEKFKAPKFFELKKAYTLTLLNYWYSTRRLREECNQTMLPVLYFYSNLYCSDCPKQGAALSYVKNKYPQQAMIFSIDFDLGKELGSVKLLRLGYNVTTVPTLIIGDKKYEGLISANELEKIFCFEVGIC